MTPPQNFIETSYKEKKTNDVTKFIGKFHPNKKILGRFAKKL